MTLSDEDRKDGLTGYEVPQEPPHPALCLGYAGFRNSAPLEERIRSALKVMARIVVNGGEEYLPIVERLEEELKNLRKKQGTLERLKRYLED
jgi:hypothetical protein